MDELQDLTPTFTDQTYHHDFGRSLPRDLSHQRRLTDTRAGKEPNALAPADGEEAIPRSNAETNDPVYCSVAAQTMTTLKAKYGDRVAFQFRHFPLSFHPNAKRAAEYAQCANEQGRFWQMHDQVFKDTKNLGEEALLASATSVGVDTEKLNVCLQSGRASQQIDIDMARGKEVGVQGTPSFFINGRQYSGNPTPEAIGAAIEKELSSS